VSHPDENANVTGFGSLSRWRLGWRTACGIAVAALALAVIAVHIVSQANLRARLMRADPDSIVEDSELRKFAVSVAQPAYDRHCATCHGAQMQGNHEWGAPNLADQDWLYGEGRVVQIEKTILHGIRSGDPQAWNLADMPAFAEPEPYWRYKVAPLAPNDIRDVVEFVLVSGGKRGDQAAATRGDAIFQGRGQCFDCHAADAKGDSAIGAPNLTDDIWLSGNGSRDDLINIVSHGRRGYCPAWGRQLGAITVRALAVLVYIASHRNAPTAAAPATGGSAGPAG
jgi:cytochrome c oxidase cbb3-type subunit III